MTIRKFLPAALGLILPIAALTASPVLAQSGAPKPQKSAHHAVHKHIHKAKAHVASTPAKTAS